MPRFRPQQSMLSGLGVAGSVLAAVVVTFALASGIVAYRLTSDDPLARASGTLVLGPQRTDAITRSPLVLRKAVATSPRGRDTAAGAATPGGGAAGSLTSAGTGRVDASPQGGGEAAKTPSQSAAPTGVGARTPVGHTLDTTSQAVSATTESLARRLHDVTGQLAEPTKPVVTGTHDALTRLLRRPPG